MNQPKENQPDHEQAENLRVLLEHHWHHCQHLESERSWFMNAYALVVGGMAAVIANVLADGTNAPVETSLTPLVLMGLLILFSFFGFCLTLRWTHAFEKHRERVNTIIKYIKPLPVKYSTDKPVDLTMNILAMEIVFPPKPEGLKKIKELFRTRYWFPLLYLFALALSGGTTYFLDGSFLKWLIVGMAAFFFVVAVWLFIGFRNSVA